MEEGEVVPVNPTFEDAQTVDVEPLMPEPHCMQNAKKAK